jgi:hypothetical protein
VKVALYRLFAVESHSHGTGSAQIRASWCRRGAWGEAAAAGQDGSPGQDLRDAL